MRISLVAAVAKNGVIGRDGDLPWHLPSDLDWFRRVTWGHHLLMGRKTWESFARALPGRTIVVITRDRGYQAAGCEVAHSLEQALDLARAAGEEEAMIAGGAEIYRQALPLADRFYLTEIDQEFEGDTVFPPWDRGEWRLASSREVEPDEANPHRHRFLVYERETAGSKFSS